MERVEELGGAVAAIEQGFQKREIERSRLPRSPSEIDDGERVVVGVNRFTRRRGGAVRAAAGRPGDRGGAGGAAAELRATRDQAAVPTQLAALRKAAEGTDNVLYPMQEALRARATVGEVCDALREVWGVYVPHDASDPVPVRPAAAVGGFSF